VVDASATVGIAFLSSRFDGNGSSNAFNVSSEERGWL
jgi:hypothetical protein